MPPLNALRAFEAVARHLSFARAAEELHVTKAAVAQQVRLLKQDVGAPLVERSGRGLKLTKPAPPAPPPRRGLSAFARAVRAMREAKGRSFLVINSSASFAATWLVARIGKFKALHPEIDVLLDANPMAIRSSRAPSTPRPLGRRRFSRPRTTLLFKEDVFRSARRPSPTATSVALPQDLSRHTLLHLEWNSAYSSWPTWSDWLKAAGARDVAAPHGVWFNHMAMAIRAAAQGQGVALTSFAIAADELAAGRLVAPFAISVRRPSAIISSAVPKRLQRRASRRCGSSWSKRRRGRLPRRPDCGRRGRVSPKGRVGGRDARK